MPSGSHRGSRGSHRSGGSRRSSSRSSSFRGSSNRGSGIHRSHHGGHLVVLGKTYTFSKPIGNIISVLMMGAFFAFFIMIASFANIPTKQQFLNVIKEDYSYYQGIISLGHTTSAEVTDMFYNSEADKYYIEYKIDIPNTSFDLEGYSYSVYTQSEALEYLNRGTIQIALNKPVSEIDSNTDSIPTDYLNMPLERDGEYIMAVKSLSQSKIFGFGGLAVFVCVIASIVIVTIKLGKKEETEQQTTEASSETSLPQFKECSYCGSNLSINETTCPSCGSKIFD